MFRLIGKVIDILFSWKKVSGVGKNPLRSKTIWGMILAWVVLALSQYAGIDLTAVEQTGIMVVIGTILRLVSHSPVGFYESDT